MAKKLRSYWPSVLVESDPPSIVFDAFDRTEHHFGGRDAGGYAVEQLLKRVARDKNPELLKRVRFDSEAGMFCSYGPDRDALYEVAKLLRGLAKGSERNARLPTGPRDEATAERHLLAGFVLGLSARAQQAFLRARCRTNRQHQSSKSG